MARYCLMLGNVLSNEFNHFKCQFSAVYGRDYKILKKNGK